MDRTSIIKEIKNILFSLEGAKALCATEKRNPTPGEIQTLDANMDRLIQFDEKLTIMDIKLAKKTVNAYAERLKCGEELSPKDQ
jgi:hypothetical protein